MDVRTYYTKKFRSLHIDRSKGTPAPHKAILLISVIQAIAAHEIHNNRIFITPELVARFKDNWHRFVHDLRFSSNFTLPFYHLKSEGFWALQTNAGKEILLTKSFSIRSFSQLKEAVAYASFSEDLYALLQDADSRTLLIDTLKHTYLGAVESQYVDRSILQEVAHQMLHEPATVYREEVVRADEEELFIRSGVFKRLIPRIYNYTCCISGMRIIASREVQMIDACHIVPFAVSHDDTVCNGLSLCPNLHRAFDRGLIALDENYRLVISQNFSENDSDYSIKKYEGSRILLPDMKDHYPAWENLRWHREHVYLN